jgi:dUTP pyrophosphatase
MGLALRPKMSFLRLRPDLDADIPIPRYMTPQASGMDIYAAVQAPLTLKVHEIALIPTGFAIALPEGYEAQIRPRSGLAIKHGIGLINSPGTIDADYRGEVKIALINLGARAFTIQRADRVAQMIIQQVCRVRIDIVEELSPTTRNDGGFGHTGMSG